MMPCMKDNVLFLPEIIIQYTEQEKNSHMKFKDYNISNILLSFLIPQCQIRTRKGEKTNWAVWSNFTTTVTATTCWNVCQSLVIYVSLHTCIKHFKLTHTKHYQSSNTQGCCEEVTSTIIIQINAVVWNLCELQVLPAHHILQDIFTGLQHILKKVSKSNK